MYLVLSEYTGRITPLGSFQETTIFFRGEFPVFVMMNWRGSSFAISILALFIVTIWAYSLPLTSSWIVFVVLIVFDEDPLSLALVVISISYVPSEALASVISFNLRTAASLLSCRAFRYAILFLRASPETWLKGYFGSTATVMSFRLLWPIFCTLKVSSTGSPGRATSGF